jgi:hypothetical protein
MKTNGTLLKHALYCMPVALIFFFYSESMAQPAFAKKEPSSFDAASQSVSSTLLYKNSNAVADKGSSIFFARQSFYGGMPVAPELEDEMSPDASAYVKTIEKFLTNPAALLKNNYSIHFKRSSFIYPRNPAREVGLTHFDDNQMRLYAQMLKKFALAHHYDTCYAFLANMGVLSTRKRFFVINLQTLEVEESGLVSHGRGQNMSIYDRNYSNDPDSKCTSLGKYAISSSYRGTFGLSYHIQGLDSSNSNAQKRKIVLHSMHCIPDMESIMPACVSEGCPAVSEHFFSSIRKLIDSRKSPMVLWIIDSNLDIPEITEMPESAPVVPKIITQQAMVKVIPSKKHVSGVVQRRRKKTAYASLVKHHSNPAVFPAGRVNDMPGFSK